MLNVVLFLKLYLKFLNELEVRNFILILFYLCFVFLIKTVNFILEKCVFTLRNHSFFPRSYISEKKENHYIISVLQFNYIFLYLKKNKKAKFSLIVL